MSHYAGDPHHRTSLRLPQIVPDFVESEYPQFVELLKAYFQFLEQYDELPVNSTYVQQSGVVSILAQNSTVIGANTSFASLSAYQKIKIAGDTYTIRQVTNNTSLVVFDISPRSHYGETFSAETNKTTRQAAGAIRQLLTFHDPQETLPEFLEYFKDTYLRHLPNGTVAPADLIPQILDFYRARGSEDAFRFLFRSLYGKEIQVSYPRDYVFCTSDGTYEQPKILKLARSAMNFGGSPVGNVYSLLGREIIGLTSNVRARVVQVREEQQGPSEVVALTLEDVIASVEDTAILLDVANEFEAGSTLLLTAFGTPPEEVQNEIYSYRMVQEQTEQKTFIAGEQLSTLPVIDPLAVTGEVLNSVVGFLINDGGSGFVSGDLIYVPPGHAGGYGAYGRVSGFAQTVITQVNVVDGGEGYYVNLPLVVDNTGTGGKGLVGYVDRVSAGNLITEDGVDHLTFDHSVDGDVLTYRAEREPVNYIEVGIVLNNVSGVGIGNSSWGGANTSSGLYGVNLGSTIGYVLGQLSANPIYINGVQTAIGEVRSVLVTQAGIDYVQGRKPIVAVQAPEHPEDVNGDPITSIPVYTPAELDPEFAEGAIGYIEVVSGGAGYVNTSSFLVGNATTTSSQTGSGANVALVLSGVVNGRPRFADVRGTSTGMHLQDESYYQPFSYVLAVEEDLVRYEDTLKRFVHPAGALLLAERTITSSDTVIGASSPQTIATEAA